jgi:hypothetical protein
MQQLLFQLLRGYNMNTEQLQASLPLVNRYSWNRELRDIEVTQVSPRSFVRDGLLFVSAEHGDAVADTDTLEVSQTLVDWAKQHGTYWEWYDNGTIVLAV